MIDGGGWWAVVCGGERRGVLPSHLLRPAPANYEIWRDALELGAAVVGPCASVRPWPNPLSSTSRHCPPLPLPLYHLPLCLRHSSLLLPFRAQPTTSYLFRCSSLSSFVGLCPSISREADRGKRSLGAKLPRPVAEDDVACNHRRGELRSGRGCHTRVLDYLKLYNIGLDLWIWYSVGCWI